MGKRVKRNRRVPPEEKRVVATQSPKVIPQEKNTSVEHVDDEVTVVKERKPCPHFDKGIDLDKLLTKLRSSEPISCEDCREGGNDRRGSKGKGKHGKKKGSVSVCSKSESKAIWVCLECGHYGCAGAGLPTASTTHAIRHLRQTRHLLVIQWDNPQLRWCFACSIFIPVEKTEENGENKDVLYEVVKLIKERSSEPSAADVEDVWFGSGSVTSAIKSEGTISYSLDEKSGYVVRGLVNLGNTCFFNSIMQNLLALNRLRDYFLNLDPSMGQLTISLKKLFAETKPEMGLKNAINPKSIFGCISAKAPQFRGYQQHDSHELLRCLLDGLYTEELALKKHINASKNDVVTGNQDLTFVDAVFGGQISSTLCCEECGHSSTVYEPFLDLSLSVPTKKNPFKKAQLVSEVKKMKIPTNKVGMGQEKVNKDADQAPAKGVMTPFPNTESSGLGHILVPQAENTAVPASSSDYSLLGSVGPSTEANETSSASQNLSDVAESQSEQVMDNRVKVNAAGADDFAWMDYLGIENTLQGNASGTDDFSLMDHLQQGVIAEENDLISRNNNISSEDKNLVLNEALAESHRVSLVEGEPNKKLHDSSGDCPLSGSVGPGTEANEISSASQNLLAITESQSEQVMVNTIKENAAGSDDFTWMDYMGMENTLQENASGTDLQQGVIAEENDLISQNSIISSEDKNLVLHGALAESCQVSLCEGEPNKKPHDSSGNLEEEELPLLVQDSEVLLLPYKEESTGTKESVRETEASSSNAGHGREELEFDGFGDMFNEPEIAAGSSIGPSLPNDVAETGFLAGNISDSDPDEVDDSDSPVSVESCLAHFLKPELLSDDNAWNCENCAKILRSQKLKAKKKQIKMPKTLINGGETQSQCEPPSLDKELSCPNGVRIISNGDISSCGESLVLHIELTGSLNQNCIKVENGQTGNLNSVVSKCEEGKSQIEGASLMKSISSVSSKSCCQEQFRGIQPVDSCNVENHSANDKFQQSNSLISENCQSGQSDYEEVDSENMKVKRNATKRVLINKAPPILTIHLKRFSQDACGRSSKLNGHVNFRETINLGPYLDPSTFSRRKLDLLQSDLGKRNGVFLDKASGHLGCDDRDSCIYHLMGVVEHSGTMRRGHYIAYVRGGEKRKGKAETEDASSPWYYVSDRSVHQVSLEEVLRSDAYVLFYEKN